MYVWRLGLDNLENKGLRMGMKMVDILLSKHSSYSSILQPLLSEHLQVKRSTRLPDDKKDLETCEQVRSGQQPQSWFEGQDNAETVHSREMPSETMKAISSKSSASR